MALQAVAIGNSSLVRPSPLPPSFPALPVIVGVCGGATVLVLLIGAVVLCKKRNFKKDLASKGKVRAHLECLGVHISMAQFMAVVPVRV